MAKKQNSKNKSKSPSADSAPPIPQKYEVLPHQSVELLKELHILTRDGKMNLDSRRKLKQIYHLFQFIDPLLQDLAKENQPFALVDHGAGKSYLGFLLYDLFFKEQPSSSKGLGSVYGIEARPDLVEKSKALAERLKFERMHFSAQSVADSQVDEAIPDHVEIVTALHACNTATDDAIQFAFAKEAKFVVLVPCCQAEVAAILRSKRKEANSENKLPHLWHFPLHAREFGSHLTNVLRTLQLEAHGYQVTVTELVGWEHSLKNELIIATKRRNENRQKQEELQKLLAQLDLVSELGPRFLK